MGWQRRERQHQLGDLLRLGGADNDPPQAGEVVDPAPCGYALTAAQAATVAETFRLHGIAATPADGGGVTVPMAQGAKPVIPLLLDGRGKRKSVSATPLSDCG